MDNQNSALERAFEIAKSGTCATVNDIRLQLSTEGYGLSQITGATLFRQLRRLMKQGGGRVAQPLTSPASRLARIPTK